MHADINVLPFPSWQYNSHVKIFESVETEADGPVDTLIYEGSAIKQMKDKTIFLSNGTALTIKGKVIIMGAVESNGKPFRGFIEVDGVSHEINNIQVYCVFGHPYSTEVELL